MSRRFLVTEEQLHTLQIESYGYDMSEAETLSSDRALLDCMKVHVPDNFCMLSRGQVAAILAGIFVEAPSSYVGLDEHARATILERLFGEKK